LTPPEQLVLYSLIEKLKNRTEDYLGKANANVTLTFPSFFNSTQKLLLHNALEEASIQSFPCPHAEDSANAATLAIRHARHHYNKPNCTSSIECIIGPSSAEVIMVEYTGSMLAFSLFNIYVGKQIQSKEYEKTFYSTEKLSYEIRRQGYYLLWRIQIRHPASPIRQKVHTSESFVSSSQGL
jgi:hypothetical protein